MCLPSPSGPKKYGSSAPGSGPQTHRLYGNFLKWANRGPWTSRSLTETGGKDAKIKGKAGNRCLHRRAGCPPAPSPISSVCWKLQSVFPTPTPQEETPGTRGVEPSATLSSSVSPMYSEVLENHQLPLGFHEITTQYFQRVLSR